MRYFLHRTAATELLRHDLGLHRYEVQLTMDRVQHDSSDVCLSTGAKLAFAAGDRFVVYGYAQDGADLALYRRYARAQSGKAQVTFNQTGDGLVAHLDAHTCAAAARPFQPRDGDTWTVVPVERPFFGRLIVRLVRLVSTDDTLVRVAVDPPVVQGGKARRVPAIELIDAEATALALTGRSMMLDRSFSRSGTSTLPVILG